MLLLAGFVAAAPVGDKGIDDVSRIFYHTSYQDLRPQIMKRQPDSFWEKLADTGLDLIGSDETVDSLELEETIGGSHLSWSD